MNLTTFNTRELRLSFYQFTLFVCEQRPEVCERRRNLLSLAEIPSLTRSARDTMKRGAGRGRGAMTPRNNLSKIMFFKRKIIKLHFFHLDNSHLWRSSAPPQ